MDTNMRCACTRHQPSVRANTTDGHLIVHLAETIRIIVEDVWWLDITSQFVWVSFACHITSPLYSHSNFVWNSVSNEMAYVSCIVAAASTCSMWAFVAVAISNRSSSGEPMCLKHLYFICERFRENAAGRPHCQCFVDYGPFGVSFALIRDYNRTACRACISAVFGKSLNFWRVRSTANAITSQFQTKLWDSSTYKSHVASPIWMMEWHIPPTWVCAAIGWRS